MVQCINQNSSIGISLRHFPKVLTEFEGDAFQTELVTINKLYSGYGPSTDELDTVHKLSGKAYKLDLSTRF